MKALRIPTYLYNDHGNDGGNDNDDADDDDDGGKGDVGDDDGGDNGNDVGDDDGGDDHFVDGHLLRDASPHWPSSFCCPATKVASVTWSLVNQNHFSVPW